MKFWKRWPGDYAAKTADLGLLEHGAYTVLLDHYYATEQPLPASSDSLARICRAFAEDERGAVLHVADRFFPIAEDGKRHNKRCDEEITSAKQYALAQSERGRLGMEKRWRKKQQPNPVANEIPPRKKSSNGKHPIGNWEPTEQDYEWARRNSFDENQVRTAFNQMKDWAVANGKVKNDWSAAWRNWLRKMRQDGIAPAQVSH